MKRTNGQFTHPATLAIGAAVLILIGLASASPLRAASSGTGQATAGTVSKSDRVEARITELHAKLSITPAQEELWSNVTQVMRDNAKTMEELAKTRSENMYTMTAVDDLKSYGGIAEAHAEGLKKFIPVFEPLYVSMSDAQKKNADIVFHRPGRSKSKAQEK
jgi:LTXXQ motif family protein